MSEHFKQKKFKINQTLPVMIEGDADLSTYQPITAIYLHGHQVSFWTYGNYAVNGADHTKAQLDITPSADSVVLLDEDPDTASSGDLIIVLQDPTSTDPPLGPAEQVTVDS